MSAMKPRSNMRSASSSTSTWHARRSNTRCLKKSMRRPGVPISTSTPCFEVRAAAFRSRRRRMPGRASSPVYWPSDLGIVVDLHRELARRREDQRAR